MDRVENPSKEHIPTVTSIKCCCCWVVEKVADVDQYERGIAEAQRVLPQLRKQVQGGSTQT